MILTLTGAPSLQDGLDSILQQLEDHAIDPFVSKVKITLELTGARYTDPVSREQSAVCDVAAYVGETLMDTLAHEFPTS